MSLDEAWAMIRDAHTGILTTLRRDGSPIALPVWHVSFDEKVFIGAPAATSKLRRIRDDSRVSFLVESGTRWSELRAVHVDARAHIVDDRARVVHIAGLLAEKYATARAARASLPESALVHYSTTCYVQLDPWNLTSWDNSRMSSSR